MQHHLIETVKNGFGAKNAWALVIGDLMLDRYLWGDVERISPEAPVPVVLIKNETECAGGSANVAANLAGLGIATRLVGFVGDDDNGARLQRAIVELGVDASAVVKAERHPTIAKTRILGGHQQMMRLDQEDRAQYSDADMRNLMSALSKQLSERPAVVVLSDYAKGVLTPQLCQAVIAEARKLNIPVLVDPKGRDYTKYTGATALTPNKREAADACGVSTHDNEALLAAAAKMRENLKLDFLALTRGEEGVSLVENGHSLHIPATAKQVFDVSGAGDTVIATLAAGLIAGLERKEALHLANLAAGVVVGKVGTAPIKHAELLHELTMEDSAQQADKVCSLDALLLRVAGWRVAGQRIVFTNGCFDLLHAGHVTYLEGARKLGDRLIVGLNTDRSVSALKGPARPVIHEADRARVMAALESVDAVVLFDQDTPLDLIRAIKPDVLAKGSDYSEDQVVGGADVKSWGGRVALVDLVPGRSTSKIIGKLVG